MILYDPMSFSALHMCLDRDHFLLNFDCLERGSLGSLLGVSLELFR